MTPPLPSSTFAALSTELHAKQPVLGGWSAALTLSERAVHALALARWTLPAKLAVAAPAAPAGAARLELELGAPRFGLCADSQSLTLRHPLLRARLVPALPGGVAASAVDSAAELPLAPDARLEGRAPLRVIPTPGRPAHLSLVLDLSSLAVAHHGLQAAPDATSVDLPARLASALADARPALPLAGFDLSPGPRPRALRPTGLHAHVARTASGEPVLHLLVAGPGAVPALAAPDVSAPVPLDDGCDYGLILDSGVVTADIATDYNALPGLVKLAAVDPSNGVDAWFVQTHTAMQFQGSVTCGDIIKPVTNQASLYMNFKGSPSDGLLVSSSTEPGANIALQLAVGGNFPVAIAPQGADDRVTLSPGPTSVSATGVAENAVKATLQSFLGGSISPNMGRISFEAPADLLFRRLDLGSLRPRVTHAQLPADLLLAGPLVSAPAA